MQLPLLQRPAIPDIYPRNVRETGKANGRSLSQKRTVVQIILAPRAGIKLLIRPWFLNRLRRSKRLPRYGNSVIATEARTAFCRKAARPYRRQ